MKAGDIACVVLASGRSERFGKPDKLAAELCGRPVLDHVLDTVSSVGFGESFLVSQRRLPNEFTVVINDNPTGGQGHALRLGVGAARAKGWENICVVLGDMPLIDAAHLQRLIRALGEKQSALSVLEGQKMPPAIFRGKAILSILADGSTSGARAIFHQLNSVAVQITDEQALDVDTPADLARVARIMETRNT